MVSQIGGERGFKTQKKARGRKKVVRKREVWGNKKVFHKEGT
jgi:hypothetical protein